MALYAGKLLRKVYDYLGQNQYSTVTGTQATNSLTDTGVVDLYPDDSWGNVFITKVTADAAPLNQFARVTQFDAANGIYTLGDNLTAAPAAGSTYAYSSSLYPCQTIFGLITDALHMIGDVPCSATLALTEGTTQYDVPVALKKSRPLFVEYQETVGDDEPWIPISRFYTRPGVAGAVGKIVFPNDVETATARVLYMGEHPEISAYSDLVNEVIDEQLAVYALAIKALEWQIGRTQGSEEYVEREYNKAMTKFRERLILFGPDAQVLEQSEVFTFKGVGS